MDPSLGGGGIHWSRPGRCERSAGVSRRLARGERLVPADVLRVRPGLARRAVAALHVAEAPFDLVAAFVSQSAPAVAIFEPGSACGCRRRTLEALYAFTPAGLLAPQGDEAVELARRPAASGDRNGRRRLARSPDRE